MLIKAGHQQAFADVMANMESLVTFAGVAQQLRIELRAAEIALKQVETIGFPTSLISLTGFSELMGP